MRPNARKPAARNIAIVMLSVVALFGLLSALGRAEAQTLRGRGEALAEEKCAGCHAVGATGQSPHPGAPPFRLLGRGPDLDAFMERLRQGVPSGHPDMPTFRLSREDADGLVAYLRYIQSP
jgi:mono/diheme cytochrome c family protein